MRTGKFSFRQSLARALAPGLLGVWAAGSMMAAANLAVADDFDRRVEQVASAGNAFYTMTNKADAAAATDWPAWGEALAKLGLDYPLAGGDPLRNAANDFLRRADQWNVDAARNAREKMRVGPNAILREIANGALMREAARTTPLAMRFTAVDGREVDLAALRGKVVLIDFWAAKWCGACKVQKPLMAEVYARYHALGFEIIGIACELKESDRGFLLDYVKKHGMPWPQFFDGKGMMNEYTRRYAITGIPVFFLIGKDGLLVAESGSSGGLSNLEAVVRRELGLPPLQPGDEDLRLGGR